MLRSGLFTPRSRPQGGWSWLQPQRSQGPAEPGTGRPLEALSVLPGHRLHPRRCLGPRGHRDCPAVMQPRNTCCLPVGQSTRGPGWLPRGPRAESRAGTVRAETRLMIPNRGPLCPCPGDIWQCLQTVLVGEGRKRCYRVEVRDAAEHPAMPRTVPARE